MTNLRFLTWNIHFKDLTHERINRIMSIISTQNPDIICLQEVPISMIDEFQLSNYFRIGISFQYSYNTLILSRYPCIRYDRYPLPKTSMGRNLLLTNIILPSGKIVYVGTFHLESVFNGTDSESLKKNQLHYIKSIIPPNTILMGDTNLVHNDLLDIEGLYDLTQHSPATYKASRLDRIITNFPLSQSQPQPQPQPIIELIGTSSHSDHNGVIITLNIPPHNSVSQ